MKLTVRSYAWFCEPSDPSEDLISTLLSLSSVVLDASVISVSISQLDAYLSKFRLRLSHDHLLRLQKLRVSLNAIQQFVIEWKRARSGQGAPESRVTEVMSAREFVGRMGKNIEGINLLDIRSYLENSKVPTIYVSTFYPNLSQGCQEDC
jgi:chromosome transmission fidelity protein 1